MSAKYICFFEEFVEKWRHMPDIKIEKFKGDLSETSVEVFWELYNQKNKESRNKGEEIHE